MPVDEERERKAVEHAETFLKHYQDIGPPGVFGAMTIRADLDRYHRAKENGLDVEELIGELESIE